MAGSSLGTGQLGEHAADRSARICRKRLRAAGSAPIGPVSPPGESRWGCSRCAWVTRRCSTSASALPSLGAVLLFLNLNDAFSLLGFIGMGFGLAAIFPILILQTNSAGRAGACFQCDRLPGRLRRAWRRGALRHGRHLRRTCRTGINQPVHTCRRASDIRAVRIHDPLGRRTKAPKEPY